MVEMYILADSIVVNSDNETITINNQEIQLRPQCHKLLVALAQCGKYDRFATFRMIGDNLWYADGGWGPDKKQSLKDCVAELRKYVPYVKSVRGKGYKLDCKVQHIPSFILGHIGTGKTRSFYEFEFDSFKLKEREIRGQLSLVTYQITNLMEHINSHIEKCADETPYQKVLKSNLLKAKASLEFAKTELSNRETELVKAMQDSLELYKKVKRCEVDFEDTKKERTSLKETYTCLADWCYDAKFEIRRLKNTINETVEQKDDFQAILSALINEK